MGICRIGKEQGYKVAAMAYSAEDKVAVVNDEPEDQPEGTVVCAYLPKEDSETSAHDNGWAYVAISPNGAVKRI